MTLESIIAFVFALWSAASAFVALTPTTKDDEVLSRVRAVAERLSFFQPKNSPGILSMPGAPATPPHAPYELDELDEDAP